LCFEFYQNKLHKGINLIGFFFISLTIRMEWNKLILKKYDKFDCVFLQKENQYFIAKNNNGIKKEKKNVEWIYINHS
jgi:hypothetical protein